MTNPAISRRCISAMFRSIPRTHAFPQVKNERLGRKIKLNRTKKFEKKERPEKVCLSGLLRDIVAVWTVCVSTPWYSLSDLHIHFVFSAVVTE